MDKNIERHIIILLGVATRNTDPKRNLTINEKLLYMIFFLMGDEDRNLRKKIYHFRQGDEYLPESIVIRNSLKNPGWYKNCWVITETGIVLTNKKGVDQFRKLMVENKPITESFARIVKDLVDNRISDNQLEQFIQLKYPLWVTKYVDSIEQTMKANPLLRPEDRTQLLKQLQDKDFISDTVKRAILSRSFTIGAKS
jgi:hypothetical protein